MTIQLTSTPVQSKFGEWELVSKEDAADAPDNTRTSVGSNRSSAPVNDAQRTSVGSTLSSAPSPTSGTVLNADDVATLQDGKSSDPHPHDVKLGLPNGGAKTSEPISEGWAIPDDAEITAAQKGVVAERNAELENKLDFLRSMQEGGAVAPKNRSAKRGPADKASSQVKSSSNEWVVPDKSEIKMARKAAPSPKEIQEGFHKQLNHTLNRMWRLAFAEVWPSLMNCDDEDFAERTAPKGSAEIKQNMKNCLKGWIAEATAKSPDGTLTQKDVDDIEGKIKALTKVIAGQLHSADREAQFKNLRHH